MRHALWSHQPAPIHVREGLGVVEGHVFSMGAQLFHGLGVSFDELALRQVESLDEFVYIIYRGHLEITSIVAPSLGTLQESYAIHRSTWKGNSKKLNVRFRGFWEDEMRRPTPHRQYP